MHPAQHGFTQEKSRIFALLEITKLSLQKRGTENTAIVTVDISGAFDNAWHPAIIQQLDNANFPALLGGLQANAAVPRSLTAAHRRRQCNSWKILEEIQTQEIREDFKAQNQALQAQNQETREALQAQNKETCEALNQAFQAQPQEQKESSGRKKVA
ncbi:hypothetical protein LAZ67_11001871 [Cordylochernes scorpioides]|uniref:Reverse transcriptase domain-containing protein n=1 Tax=Cordylochernes scorpioides TaxID=51811 RepID=A0ABY6L3M1_9ARAC|nr:hypothetical protein LAZ67_11001871 [Cordylochernes scorpioides]